MPGPWDKYAGQTAQPAMPAMGDPVVKAAPVVKAPDPLVQQGRQLDIELKRKQLAKPDAAAKDPKVTEGERKAAGFVIRAQGANDNFTKVQSIGGRGLVGQAVADNFPNIANVAASPERQLSDNAQREFIASVLRLDSGAAIPDAELITNQRIYFPQPGDSPEVLKQKEGARWRAINSLRIQAGQEPLPEPETQQDAAQQGGGDQQTSPWPGVIGEDGKPLPPEGGYGRDPETGEWGMYGDVTDDSESSEHRAARELADKRSATYGESDAARVARQGVTLGLSDEVAGVGTAIGRALTGDFNVTGNYEQGRDADRILNDRARENLGWGGTALEVVSGGAGIRGVAGAAGSLIRQGAGIGALGGYGYGEGAAGSGVNALAGAAIGGGVGAVGQKAANALTNRAQASNLPQRAATLNQAGQAEGVTVNRAMVDPLSNNAVTKADATLIGGRKVQREMGAIEGQVESRVNALGRGGQALDDIALGSKVKQAGERFIDKSGKAANAKYNRAEQMAGNAKVEPKESLSRVRTMIGELSEMENSNSAELAYLRGLESDLSKDLSVGALRKQRTKLRKKISKGDLVFGEDEARVLEIMDGAADDIRNGLTAQGKGNAARAFDVADKAYRARMEYVSGTVQKLLGKRNANVSPEQIASKFRSMTQTDAQGLRKFYATLAPDEAADVAATFAERLGTNAKDDFTVTQFLRQTSSKAMSDEALRTIFGKEGAESVRNLRVLGQEVERVTGSMNSRTSKSGVASYRDWLWTAGTGILGGATQGISATAVGATATVAGATAANQAISARLLMSPKISKWLAQAPNTTNPAAINAHYERLSAIAKAEPALAGEIDTLRKAILGAANDNAPAKLAAEDQDSKEVR